MNDEQIEKLAVAVANALNKSETVGKRKIVDNSKKIKSLQKEIEKKKKLLQKIEKGEIKGLHMSKVTYGGVRVQGGKRGYRSNLEKLEDLKEKINREIIELDYMIFNLECEESDYLDSIWDDWSIKKNIPNLENVIRDLPNFVTQIIAQSQRKVNNKK